MPVSECSGGEGGSSSHPWLQGEQVQFGLLRPCLKKTKMLWKIRQGITVQDYHGSPAVEVAASHPQGSEQTLKQCRSAALRALRESISFLPCQGYTQTNSFLRWVFPCQHSYCKAVNRHSNRIQDYRQQCGDQVLLELWKNVGGPDSFLS